MRVVLPVRKPLVLTLGAVALALVVAVLAPRWIAVPASRAGGLCPSLVGLWKSLPTRSDDSPVWIELTAAAECRIWESALPDGPPTEIIVGRAESSGKALVVGDTPWEARVFLDGELLVVETNDREYFRRAELPRR